jgi:hypothetical protein
LKAPPRLNYGVPHAYKAQFHLQSPKFKPPTKEFFIKIDLILDVW